MSWFEKWRNQKSVLIFVHLRSSAAIYFFVDFCVRSWFWTCLKKQNQSRALAGNPKSEYRNPKRFDGCVLKKQTQFSNRENDVKSMWTMVYGDFDGPRQRKNKANLFRTECCVMRTAKKRFEKTKPISERDQLHKLLYERILWQYDSLWGTKKQSQFVLAIA